MAGSKRGRAGHSASETVMVWSLDCFKYLQCIMHFKNSHLQKLGLPKATEKSKQKLYFSKYESWDSFQKKKKNWSACFQFNFSLAMVWFSKTGLSLRTRKAVEWLLGTHKTRQPQELTASGWEARKEGNPGKKPAELHRPSGEPQAVTARLGNMGDKIFFAFTGIPRNTGSAIHPLESC